MRTCPRRRARAVGSLAAPVSSLLARPPGGPGPRRRRRALHARPVTAAAVAGGRRPATCGCSSTCAAHLPLPEGHPAPAPPRRWPTGSTSATSTPPPPPSAPSSSARRSCAPRSPPATCRAGSTRSSSRIPCSSCSPLLDKVRWLFLAAAGRRGSSRDMSPVRPFLSDATYQRFNVQLQLMTAQGVRDAIADMRCWTCSSSGCTRATGSTASTCACAPACATRTCPRTPPDAQAIAAAKRRAAEAFTEVWTFVRKPGAQTRIGEDLFQGKCPNCGAPYKGGASNPCEFCSAVVNSGNYDWTLSEITQGVEHVRHHTQVDGLMQAREADPALNLEMLEDRASLVFWKWIDAQSRGETKRLSKVATRSVIARLERGADGAAPSRAGAASSWSARWAASTCARWRCTRTLRRGPRGDPLERPHGRGARERAAPQPPHRAPALGLHAGAPPRRPDEHRQRHGHRPLPAVQRAPHGQRRHHLRFCGTVLGNGERDWVLASALPFESWNVQRERSGTSVAAARHRQARAGGARRRGGARWRATG